jgi:hypothetical protein
MSRSHAGFFHGAYHLIEKSMIVDESSYTETYPEISAAYWQRHGQPEYFDSEDMDDPATVCQNAATDTTWLPVTDNPFWTQHRVRAHQYSFANNINAYFIKDTFVPFEHDITLSFYDIEYFK